VLPGNGIEDVRRLQNLSHVPQYIPLLEYVNLDPAGRQRPPLRLALTSQSDGWPQIGGSRACKCRQNLGSLWDQRGIAGLIEGDIVRVRPLPGTVDSHRALLKCRELTETWRSVVPLACHDLLGEA